jgi:NADPH:quinone reductase-like Zn-dependent oxidoreductase
MDAIGSILKWGKNVTQWKEGDRVAVLLRTGGNARYVNVPANSLVEVPRILDNAEAACMVTTYMTAYQSLKLACRSLKPMPTPVPPPPTTTTTMTFKSKAAVAPKPERFLQGRRVLITEGISPIGQALIQLCALAGADQIFATAPETRHRYIKSVLRAKPLPLDPKVWLPMVQGKMDVVFDGSCDDGFESPHAAMTQRGVMVVFGMSSLLSKEEPGFWGAPMTAYWAKLKGQMLLSNTKSYECWESFQSDPETYKVGEL